MAMKQRYLIVFSVLHLVVGISCLLVTISIATLEGKLDIQCGLYIQVTNADSSNSDFTYSSSTSHATCQYLKWMNGIAFVISVALMIYHLYPAIARQPRFSVQPTVCWVITIITGFLLFVASCIISAGFRKSCFELQKVYDKGKQVNYSCKDRFDWTKFAGSNARDPAIYTFLSIAQASSWTAFLAIAVCIAISSLYFFWRSCRVIMSSRVDS